MTEEQKKKKKWDKGGESPNPGGMKPGEREARRAVRDIAQEILAAKCDLKDKKGELKYPEHSRLKALMIRLHEFAMSRGNMQAARILLEYAYGKPAQVIEGGADNTPIKIQMIGQAVDSA